MVKKQAEMATSRRTAHQIYDVASDAAKEELERSYIALAISGVAGGLTMGLTGLSTAVAFVTLGDSPMREFLSMLLYPIGFLAVIIGRAQLFTENTLYPVILVLDDWSYAARTLKLWTVVLASNVFGAGLFAGLAVQTPALRGDFQQALVTMGLVSSQRSFDELFWSGIIGGWLIALVAWMVAASHWTSGQFLVIYLFTFVVGAGHFAHCIAGSGEVLAATISGAVSWGRYFYWLAAATAGNIVGGVFIVSLLNWGQVFAGVNHED